MKSVIGMVGIVGVVGMIICGVSITSTPSDAGVTVEHQSGTDVRKAAIPTTVTLSASGGFFEPAEDSLQFEKEGSDPALATLSAAHGPRDTGNVLSDGLAGLFIADPATEAMWMLDDAVYTALSESPSTPGQTLLSPLSLQPEALAARPPKRHVFEIGIEASHITYKEPGFMEEEGDMSGVLFSYAHYSRIFFWKIGGELTAGLVDYSNSGELEDIDDLMFEFRLLFGLHFPLHIAKSSFLGPYWGFGYRYLNDDSSGMTSTTGAAGYNRESNYLYLPVGVEGVIGFGKGWSIGMSLEPDIFLAGVQVSHLSDADPACEDAYNLQGSGFGFRCRAKVQYEFGGIVALTLEPFIKYWNIQKSEEATIDYGGVDVVVWEPKNNSTEIGAMFVISIGF
jgi:hypothetical protein